MLQCNTLHYFALFCPTLQYLEIPHVVTAVKATELQRVVNQLCTAIVGLWLLPVISLVQSPNTQKNHWPSVPRTYIHQVFVSNVSPVRSSFSRSSLTHLFKCLITFSLHCGRWVTRIWGSFCRKPRLLGQWHSGWKWGWTNATLSPLVTSTKSLVVTKLGVFHSSPHKMGPFSRQRRWAPQLLY